MTLDQKILELIKNYMVKLFHKKVLTTMEEVEASTNETNLVAAPVVAELNNKLNGCSLEQEGSEFYIIGADAVRKKLGDSVYKLPEQQKVFIPEMLFNINSMLFILTFGKKVKVTFNGKPLTDLTYWFMFGYGFLSDADSASNGVTDNSAVFRHGSYNRTSLNYNKKDGVLENSDKCKLIYLDYDVSTGPFSFKNIEIEWLDE